MKKLSLGIIGAGAIMRERHWPNLAKIPGIEIACVCNSNPRSAQSFLDFAGRHAEVLSDWRDVVSHRSVDVVWVAAPPLLHKECVVAAIDAGKPVFCQARMARDLGEAIEMRNAHRSKPEVVAAFCRAPFGLEVGLTIKEMIRSNKLGEALSLDFKHLTNCYADPDAPVHWRQQVEINGINFLTCGIFAEVLFNWFGAPAEVVACGKVVHQFRGTYRVSLPDYAHVLAKWDSGLIGSLTWSGIHYGTERPELNVQFEHGRLRVLFQPDELWVSDAREAALRLVQIPENQKGRWSVEQDFINAVRGESVCPGVTFDEGVRYMAFTQSVFNSILQDGASVKLPIV